jgi:hypothetical protein
MQKYMSSGSDDSVRWARELELGESITRLLQPEDYVIVFLLHLCGFEKLSLFFSLYYEYTLLIKRNKHILLVNLSRYRLRSSQYVRPGQVRSGQVSSGQAN